MTKFEFQRVIDDLFLFFDKPPRRPEVINIWFDEMDKVEPEQGMPPWEVDVVIDNPELILDNIKKIKDTCNGIPANLVKYLKFNIDDDEKQKTDLIKDAIKATMKTKIIPTINGLKNRRPALKEMNKQDFDKIIQTLVDRNEVKVDDSRENKVKYYLIETR